MEAYLEFVCDWCMKIIVQGDRFRCMVCHDFDLCQICHWNGRSNRHTTSHPIQHIKDDVANNDIVHCNSCGQFIPHGNRYKCMTCRDYDLCLSCHSGGDGGGSGVQNGHASTHPMKVIKKGLTSCKMCNSLNLPGIGFTCLICYNYDLCRICQWKSKTNNHSSNHPMQLLNDASNIDIACDVCGRAHFKGTRYKCMVCRDHDLCSSCHRVNRLAEHSSSHPMDYVNEKANVIKTNVTVDERNVIERNVTGNERNVSTDGRNVTIGERNVTVNKRNVIAGSRNSNVDERNISTDDRSVAAEERNTTDKRSVTHDERNATFDERNVTVDESKIKAMTWVTSSEDPSTTTLSYDVALALASLNLLHHDNIHCQTEECSRSFSTEEEQNTATAPTTTKTTERKQNTELTPPSTGISNQDGEASNSAAVQNALCKRTGCEFFGNDEFGGYCYMCLMDITKEESMLKQSNVGKEYIVGKGNTVKPVLKEIVEDEDKNLCVICLEREYNTVLIPCGHMWLCFECAASVKSCDNNCPACRKEIDTFIRVYTPD